MRVPGRAPKAHYQQYKTIMENPHAIKATIEYSDGTQTVISYHANDNKESIENRVAQDTAIGEAKDRGETVEPVKERKARKVAVKKTVAKKARK